MRTKNKKSGENSAGQRIWGWLRKNWLPLGVGVVVYVYALIVMPGTFEMSALTGKAAWVRFLLVQVAFLGVDFGTVLYLTSMIRRIRAGDKAARNWLKLLMIILIINVAILLIIWPGYWVNDELGVLWNAKEWNYYSWQNYLTVIFYSVCLMLIPAPVGIVIMQMVFISLVMTYFISCVYQRTQSKWTYLLLAVLLLPPVICNNFYPLRITMNAYLDLLVIVWVYEKYSRKKGFVWWEVVGLGVGCFMLAFWRTEGIYYLGAPIIIYLFFRGNEKILAKSLAMFGVAAGLYMGFSAMDHLGEGEWAFKYKTTAVINPLSTMLTEESVQENSAEEIAVIDEVMDTKMLADKAEYWNITAFLEDTASDEINLYRESAKEKQSGFFGNFLKMVMKNPGAFLKNRLKVFAITNGSYLPEEDYQALNALVSFEEGDPDSQRMLELGVGPPINQQLRLDVLKFLRGESFAPIKYFWNVIPVILLVAGATVYLLLRRRWLGGILMGSLLVRAGIVFLTTPASFFMYYFPIYVEGILLCAGVVMIDVKSKPGRLRQKNEK